MNVRCAWPKCDEVGIFHTGMLDYCLEHYKEVQATRATIIKAHNEKTLRLKKAVRTRPL